MGAGNSINMIYYSISNGKIVRQVPNKTEISVGRTNKNQKPIHEEFYDYLDGILMDIYIKESEYGRFWNVVLQDTKSGLSQTLQINYSSGYAKGFLKALPNVDVAAPLTIIPNTKKDGDKTKTTVFLKQHNSTLKWHFTREHPNGLPALKKIKLKGLEMWDDTAVMEFLEQVVKKQILSKLLVRSSKEILKSHPVDGSDGLPF